MIFVDTHSHLFSEKFHDDILEVIKRAQDHNIERILLPNIDVNSIDHMHACEDMDPLLFYSMMGIHPCDIKEDFQQQLDIAHEWFEQRKYCAVGEIGIDLYWDKTHVEQQKQAFRTQLKWAKELKLPVAIHARDSFQEIFEIVEQENNEDLTGVFHCFTGGLEEAEKIMSFGGFKMGLGGVLTFKKSGLDKTVAELPLDEFVLETDSPYLAPSPFRGKRNESSYLIYIAEKLAEVKNEPLSVIAEVTTKNANELFKLNL